MRRFDMRGGFELAGDWKEGRREAEDEEAWKNVGRTARDRSSMLRALVGWPENRPRWSESELERGSGQEENQLTLNNLPN